MNNTQTNPTYTLEDIDEIRTCAEDPTHFITANDFQHPTTLSKDLRRMLEVFNRKRFVDVTHERQVGATSTTMAYLLWLIMYNENMRIGLVAHNHDASKRMLSILVDMHSSMHDKYKIPKTVCNKSEFKLDNNSQVSALSTQPLSIRGRTWDVVVFDNTAMSTIQHGEWLESIIPQMHSSRNGKVFALSSDGDSILRSRDIASCVTVNG